MTTLKIQFIDHTLYQHFMEWFNDFGMREFEEYMIGETGVNGIEVIKHDTLELLEISNEYNEGWGL